MVSLVTKQKCMSKLLAMVYVCFDANMQSRRIIVVRVVIFQSVASVTARQAAEYTLERAPLIVRNPMLRSYYFPRSLILWYGAS